MITSDTAKGVCTITLARPEKKNALSLAVYQALTHALNTAASDNNVHAVLIAGQPGVFTAGNDLEDFLAAPPTTQDSPIIEFMRTLMAFEKPVIAAVTGTAVGIGVTMLFHCDLVYVSEDARLSMPFVALGVVPEFSVSLLLPLLIGHVKAAEKLMLGTPFTAAEAVSAGLANAALPAGEVLNHARQIAERFNALPAGAVRDTKRLMRAGLRDAVEQTMNDEIAVFFERLRSPEAREAFQAFFEKRKPDFSKL
jgi:enoyl-CoA hydratase/carnithine racemase